MENHYKVCFMQYLCYNILCIIRFGGGGTVSMIDICLYLFKHQYLFTLYIWRCRKCVNDRYMSVFIQKPVFIYCI